MVFARNPFQLISFIIAISAIFAHSFSQQLQQQQQKSRVSAIYILNYGLNLKLNYRWLAYKFN